MPPLSIHHQLRRLLAQRRAPAAVCLSHRTRNPPTAPIIHLSRSLSTSPRLRQESQAPLPVANLVSSSPAPSSSNPTAPPPNPPRRKIRWASATIFLLIGALSGTVLRAVISPPPPPLPGSPADEALKEDIRALAEQLPIVKQLLAEPGWTHHEAYAAFPAATKPNRITTGPLATAAGIGAYQHIFHPPAGSGGGEPIIGVLFFGLSTTGWPGVVHGGLLSTILDEHSARAALAETAGRGGVLTANLELSYLRPTLAGGFYVAKARALQDEELEPRERGKRDRKIWVDVWLETLEGVECVRGRALFVIPKGRQLKGLAKGF